MAARKSKAASRPRSHSPQNRVAKSSRTANGRTARGNGAHPELDHSKLLEFLSQMLAVEKGGVMLYEKALNQLTDEELREDLEEFLEQTRRHVELCEEMIEQAGGSSDESTPAAEAAEAKANGLISVEVPEEMNDFNNIENLVLAETKDNWNWEMLAEMSRMVRARELRSTIARAVREVSRQERKHVDWNTRTLSELGRQMMSGREEQEEMDEEEEMQEEV